MRLCDQGSVACIDAAGGTGVAGEQVMKQIVEVHGLAFLSELSSRLARAGRRRRLIVSMRSIGLPHNALREAAQVSLRQNRRALKKTEKVVHESCGYFCG